MITVSESPPESDQHPLADREWIYRALCQILAGQPHRESWPAFSPTDWDRLIATARAEGVAPLLYHILEVGRGGREGREGKTERRFHPPSPILHPPSSILHELRTAYYATAAHNLLLYHELARILDAFTNSPAIQPSSHPVILLKGAALATTLYPNSALRPLSDIDLLILRQHLEPAVQAVKSLGYREPYPEMLPGHNQAAGHHTHLRGGPRQGIVVELHWNLVGSDSDWRTPSMEWFWEQTEEWKMERGEGKGESGKGKMARGKEVPSLRPGSGQTSDFHSPISNLQSPISNTQSPIFTLTPTANLLYLSAHLMLQHGATQARLIWYYDLHLLATREAGRLDWDELLAQAREFRWTAALHAALQGVQERFATPLPAGFLDALAEVQDRQAVRSVARKAGPVQTRAVRVWDTLEAQSWHGRLHLAWAIACPRPEYMRWRYRPRPAWLWPLWYPYRWFDMVRDGLATVWRIGRGKMEGRKGEEAAR